MLRAVIVGVDAHADPRILPLRCARADAEALAKFVEERVVGDREITLLLDESATKSAVERLLTDELPARVAPEDVTLFYFAGYGAPDVDPATGDPSRHLVLHDTRFSELFSTGLNLVSELSAWLRRLSVTLVTTVLDTSFSGGDGGRTFDGPGLLNRPRIRRLEGRSCARLGLGVQAAVLTGCSATEPAREDAALGHGIFTHHFLDGLRRSPGGAVHLGALHSMVGEAVRAASHGEQNPELYGSCSARVLFHLGGRLPVAPLESTGTVQNPGLGCARQWTYGLGAPRRDIVTS